MKYTLFVVMALVLTTSFSQAAGRKITEFEREQIVRLMIPRASVHGFEALWNQPSLSKQALSQLKKLAYGKKFNEERNIDSRIRSRADELYRKFQQIACETRLDTSSAEVSLEEAPKKVKSAFFKDSDDSEGNAFYLDSKARRIKF